MPLIRSPAVWVLVLAVVPPSPALAQGTAGRAENPEAIDILISRPKGEADPRLVEECRRQEDAALISQEIVVCREIRDNADNYYSGDRETAQRRYAEETAFAGDLVPPDVSGPGIFQGPAAVGSLCLPGLQKCPPPPALIIDVTALPQAPPGSDADRIARGLPPIGRDEVTSEPSPAGSAEPAAER